MHDWLAEFHLLRPWWLLALAALPLLWRALGRHADDAGAWRGVVDAHLLPHLLDGPEAGSAPSPVPRRLAAIAWVLACLALAGPAWERLPQPLFQNRAARVIALELAPTMAAQDVKPSRYERARYKIADLLKRNGDGQVALIAYAGDAFVVAPLTDDANTVANLVDALEPSVMPVAGNATGRAIELGVHLIHGAGLSQGEIVLLADGVGDDGLIAAERARAAGVRVSALGIGTAQGAPVPLPQGGFLKDASGDIVLPRLDGTALRTLARLGGGRYVDWSIDASDLDALGDAHSAHAAAAARATEATTTRYRDRGPWLVLCLLPIVALLARRGWLLLLPLALLAHSEPAAALSWRDLWLTPDQQAKAALDAGHAAEAQALARDPALRGAAAYRAGDYARAVEEFARRNDADAQYNRGNALAKAGRYEDAIAAYDAALRLRPDLADAAANKRAVEEWLKRQRQDAQSRQDREHQGHEQKEQDSSGSDADAANGTPSSNAGQANRAAQAGQDHSSPTQRDGSRPASPERPSDDDAAAAAAEQRRAEPAEREAEGQFREDMNRALARQGEGGDKPAPAVRLGALAKDAGSDERAQAVEQWLQRVPDDPGGLLRRKFQLEYQRRRHGGGD